MKKVVLIFVFIVAAVATHAQSDTTKYVYLQIQSIGKMGGRSRIEADFGYTPYYIDEKTRAEIKAGLSTFESHLDALSFLSALGWQYVEMFTLNPSGNTLFYFIFKKPKIAFLKK